MTTNKQTLIAVILAISMAAPAFAGGGGRGGGRGGGGQGGAGGFGGQGGAGFAGQGGAGAFGAGPGTGGAAGGAGGGRIGGGTIGGLTAGTTPQRTSRTQVVNLNSPNPGPPVILEREYSELNSYSIFSDNRPRRSNGQDPIVDDSQLTTPIITVPVQPRPTTAAPVFRAFLQGDDGKPVAELETLNRDGTVTNILYHEGDVIDWNSSKIISITKDGLRLPRAQVSATSNNYFDVPLGSDIQGYQVGQLPTSPSYLSYDAQGVNPNQQTTGRGTRGGGRGGAAGGGGFGGAGGGGFGGAAGGGLNGNIGGVAGGLATQLVSPTLDPPLPPGSADDIASRMAQRRQIQINQTGGTDQPIGLPANAATPLGTPGTPPTPPAPGAAPATPGPGGGVPAGG